MSTAISAATLFVDSVLKKSKKKRQNLEFRVMLVGFAATQTPNTISNSLPV